MIKRYTTGSLDMPMINAVNEGMVVLMTVSVCFGVVGNDKWQSASFIPGWSYMTLFVMSMILLVLVTTIVKFYK